MGIPDLSDTSFVDRSPAMERAVQAARRLLPDWRGLLVVGGPGCGKRRLTGLALQASARFGEQLGWYDCTAPQGDLSRRFDGLADPQHALRLGRPFTVVLDRVDRLSAEACGRFVSRMWRSTYMLSPSARVVATSRASRESLEARGASFVHLLAHLDLGDLRVPSLHRRGPDVPELVRLFMSRICEEHAVPEMRLSIAAVDALRAYSWPGNVTELDEVLRWAVLAADRYEQVMIRFEDLPASVRGEDEETDERSDAESPIGRGSTLAAIEKEKILAAADKFGGDRRAMAEELGVSVNTIWRRMREFGRVREYRKADPAPKGRRKKPAKVGSKRDDP